MAYYTVMLIDLVKQGFDLGLNDYPIFDENYRQRLNNKIIDHYAFEEIGYDVPARFKFELNQTLYEIMPYYNELYKAQLSILTKPIDANVNLTETNERNQASNASSTSNSVSTGSSNNKGVYQDTPTEEILQEDLESLKHASNFTMGNANQSNDINDASNSLVENIDNYVKIMVGNNGTKYSVEMIGTLKSNLINIDLEIIQKLKPNFMGLWM